MKRILHLMIFAALVMSVAACGHDPSTANADSIKPESAPSSVLDKLKSVPKVTVPAGTKLRVALIDAVSSDKSRAGDPFFASLTEPVIVNGKTVLVKGTRL